MDLLQSESRAPCLRNHPINDVKWCLYVQFYNNFSLKAFFIFKIKILIWEINQYSIFDDPWPTFFSKNQIFCSVLWWLVQNIINITSVIIIVAKFGFTLRLSVRYCQITAFWLVFCKLEMELLQVDMVNYHLKNHFQLLRNQMSHCYLCSKCKNYIKSDILSIL